LAEIVLEVPNPNQSTAAAAKDSEIKMGLNLKHRNRDVNTLREVTLSERNVELQSGVGGDGPGTSSMKRAVVGDVLGGVRWVTVSRFITTPFLLSPHSCTLWCDTATDLASPTQNLPNRRHRRLHPSTRYHSDHRKALKDSQKDYLRLEERKRTSAASCVGIDSDGP
jgi:hypothetical protein